jgi:hypothetical protein
LPDSDKSGQGQRDDDKELEKQQPLGFLGARGKLVLAGVALLIAIIIVIIVLTRS